MECGSTVVVPNKSTWPIYGVGEDRDGTSPIADDLVTTLKPAGKVVLVDQEFQSRRRTLQR